MSGFQTAIPISDAINRLDRNVLLLPSFQRDFVWTNDKIENLFDSLMKFYPISSFLFWEIADDTLKNEHKYYTILKEYREQFKTHNEEFKPTKDFLAILDGQQRLTALYIGLKGSFAWKKLRVTWKDTEQNIPTRRLYLNILEGLKDNEEGRTYDFRFLTQEEFNNDGKNKKWFKVGEILGLEDDFQFNKYLDSKGYKENEFTYQTLARLKKVIFSANNGLDYYLETDKDYDKAANIFIRINNGGEPLSYSDLLVSICIASWKELDARKEFDNLVDDIKGEGFFIDRDFILKTYLVLYSTNIAFKVNNFNREMAEKFQTHWPDIRSAIYGVFLLIKSFGFTEKTLTSKYALIPLIYYFYHSGFYEGFHDRIQFKEDRVKIRKWLHVVLLYQVFSRSDAILIKTRNAMTGKEKLETEGDFKVSAKEFPYNNINDKLRTTIDLTVTDQFIEDLLKTEKDDAYCFSILAILYSYLDFKNPFHKDHLHPESSFDEKKSKELKMIDPQKIKFYLARENWNSILNLQLLDTNENESKLASNLKEWVEKNKIDLDKHLIPNPKKLNKPNILEFSEFEDFIAERKKILIAKLKSELQ